MATRPPTAPGPVRLHIVTGKGGTGKTTVAAALALALARPGRRVLLTEVEGRQGIASAFGRHPLPYAERMLTETPEGGQVWGLAVDAEDALLDYLARFYHLGTAGRALDRVGAIDFATTVAPGARDVLLIGKVYEAARRIDKGGPRAYDAVVLDGPPTGRIGAFLNVSSAIAGVAKAGPIHRQARSVAGYLASPRTRAHLVTTAEEMPVQEALDAISALGACSIKVADLIANELRSRYLSRSELTIARQGRLDRTQIAASLAAAALPTDHDFVAELCSGATAAATRATVEDTQLRRLRVANLPVMRLPALPDASGRAALGELSGLLAAALDAEHAR
ncbi:MAG: ArsA-related P-loop ATPase [Sciscionella sp.]